MQNSQELISHLKSKPQFFRLKQHECFSNIIKLMPPRFKDGIKYAFAKGETIYFVFNHPSLKMEFDSNKTMFSQLLRDSQRLLGLCGEFKILKPFVTHQIEKSQPKPHDTLELFSEKSTGKFENIYENAKLKSECDRIKEIIKGG